MTLSVGRLLFCCGIFVCTDTLRWIIKFTLNQRAQSETVWLVLAREVLEDSDRGTQEDIGFFFLILIWEAWSGRVS